MIAGLKRALMQLHFLLSITEIMPKHLFVVPLLGRVLGAASAVALDVVQRHQREIEFPLLSVVALYQGEPSVDGGLLSPLLLL